MGLETNKRGMSVAQNALHTTGNNVANANTPGYTRQRVNLVQTSGFPGVGLNAPAIPGHLGTVVEADTIQRIRDTFLDTQYRSQNSKVGYYGTLSESYLKMEGIMNDPTDSGLASTMEKFWNSLQKLTTNSENAGARAVVASTGEAVADTLNYYYNSLKNVQEDIKFQTTTTQSDINSILSNIHNLNTQISKIEPNGYLPNGLYDERDSLVDKLSSLVSVKVTAFVPEEYGNVNRASATGLYNIELVKEDGTSYDSPIQLLPVDNTGLLGEPAMFEISYNDEGYVESVQIGDETVDDITFAGEFAGLIKSYGYGDQGGLYPDMLKKLNELTKAFANEFNEIHQGGYDLNGDTGVEFFSFGDPDNPAQTITINTDILANPSLVAAGLDSGSSGDNQNAHALAAIKSKNFDDYANLASDELTGTFDSYYSGLIGRLGVESESVQKDHSNATTIAASVEQNRKSVSAVSMDEEMADMIKFQQSYNASARMITVVDEMLDKIINGMGTGGR